MSSSGVIISSRIIELSGKFPFAPPSKPAAAPSVFAWAGRYPFAHVFYRVLEHGYGNALFDKPKPPTPNMTWAEQPIAMLRFAVMSLPSVAPQPPPAAPPPVPMKKTAVSDTVVRRTVIAGT
jgi:hypothetical protein